jgi:hypothetical protein
MVADDLFRSRLQATIADLRQWGATVSHATHMEQTEGHDFWKLAVTPLVHAACPFELVLRMDQKYDISIAGETYEDLPIGRLELFLPLITAIASGKAVQRHTLSASTEALLAVETLVPLPHGETWSKRREIAGAPNAPTDETLINDRYFLPYTR